jgi:hypothetical protein
MDGDFELSSTTDSTKYIIFHFPGCAFHRLDIEIPRENGGRQLAIKKYREKSCEIYDREKYSNVRGECLGR